ncbi:hypothetical protein VE03_03123 [Pseudogymnoascus sp. 23342-1-I1]|nr:hypothetical protein VE03_03123 [Pseudogymnoascus sp. 23342-1-I1]
MLPLTKMYGINSIFRAMIVVTVDPGDTSHPLREATTVWILCVSIAFVLFINAWAIRVIRQRMRGQEAASANPERAESPARWLAMGSLSAQVQSRTPRLGHQLQALSSTNTLHISPPEQPTGGPSDPSNDTERNDERFSVAAGDMASFSLTPDQTEEQLPKYMERDHDLPDYADQNGIPAT